VKIYLSEFDNILPQDSDCFLLLIWLRSQHRNLEFYLRNDTHRRLGWTRKRFVRARNKLIDNAAMIMVEPPRNAPMICQLTAAA
jgi:hypothetical protein